MKKTKEWISDYLRYFLLILAIVLLVFLIVITLKVYQRYDKKSSGTDIEILTEAGTEKISERPSEKMTEREAESETEAESESGTESELESETERQATAASVKNTAQTQPESGDDSAGAAAEPQPQEGEGQPQENSPEQAEPDVPAESTGDYRTIISACNLRSYPDYGDNVIGECYAGQTVEFLGEEAGWYKISVDGTVGYIGPKFLG